MPIAMRCLMLMASAMSLLLVFEPSGMLTFGRGKEEPLIVMICGVLYIMASVLMSFAYLPFRIHMHYRRDPKRIACEAVMFYFVPWSIIFTSVVYMFIYA